MTTKMYFFITWRIIIFFGSLAITSQLLSNSHEILGDQYIDMDNKENWRYEWSYKSDPKQVRDCTHGSIVCSQKDHWHWSWLHTWIFWGSVVMTIFNLIFIISQIEKKAKHVGRPRPSTRVLMNSTGTQAPQMDTFTHASPVPGGFTVRDINQRKGDKQHENSGRNKSANNKLCFRSHYTT